MGDRRLDEPTLRELAIPQDILWRLDHMAAVASELKWGGLHKESQKINR